MNQIYYDYIQELHEQQLGISQRHRELQNSSPIRTTLRSRSLLTLSDLLLNLGQRIRPAEFQVQGTLEINTEGC